METCFKGVLMKEKYYAIVEKIFDNYYIDSIEDVVYDLVDMFLQDYEEGCEKARIDGYKEGWNEGINRDGYSD